MNLVIDQGNTSIKIFLFDKDVIVEKRHLSKFGANAVMELIREVGTFEYSIYASVSTVEMELEWLLTANSKKYLFLNYQTPLPITIDYKTPQTLGVDRVAAAVGVSSLFPGRNVVVFDIGTAMTIDFITDMAVYLGGNISPGPRTMLKALNQFTSKLPLIEPSVDFNLIGNSTNQAILNGVMNCIVFEIEKYWDEFSKQYSNPIAVITGGDSLLFVNKIKNPIFAEPNLVAIGLNRILNYNVATRLS